MTRFALACVGVALAAGCTRESAPPIAEKPPPVVVAPSSSAPIKLLPPLPPIQHHPPLCEVEVFGRVQGASPTTAATIFLSDGDCLAPGAHMLGASPAAKDGSFRVEVFAPWGSDVSICAAMIPADGKAATSYGKASGTFHAEQLGEVVFREVEIAMKTGAPKTFARPGSSAAPSAGVPRGAPLGLSIHHISRETLTPGPSPSRGEQLFSDLLTQQRRSAAGDGRE